MEQSPCLEAVGHSVVQEISHLPWRYNVVWPVEYWQKFRSNMLLPRQVWRENQGSISFLIGLPGIQED
jgi:hypothetical protein